MRIRNSGSGFGGYGGQESRSDSFRQKHRLGQKVRGVLLKNMADSMAWVSIDGDKLLANLQRLHPEGTRLTFIIKQLTPDIVLKEIFESTAATAGALGLTSSFDTARTLFENEFKKVVTSTFKPGSSESFVTLLAARPKLATLYKDAANCILSISNLLDNAPQKNFLYQPWLIPSGSRQVTLVRNSPETHNSLTETIVEFEHMSWGLTRAEFLYKAKRVACKFKVQHPNKVPLSLFEKSSNQHFGLSKLPPRHHGGLISEHIFRVKQ